MNKTTQKQNETIKETSSNFDVIKESVSSVSDKVAVQEKRMQDITVANEKIVDSINTISATSEEVTAGSQQTLDVTESNKEVIEKVNADVRALKDKMEELTKL